MCLQAILLSTVLIPLLDAPYLYLNKDLYLAATKAISGGRGFTNRYYSALLVYIALAIGVAVLAVPNIRTSSWNTLVLDSLKWGGIFGLAAYATFDFTAHFMFDDWTLRIAVMDTIWGTILCSLAAGIVALIMSR
jgi:uncharacterized membrane protein